MSEGDVVEDVLRELARESARTLAELGVRAGDEKWIREHARTVASLKGGARPPVLLSLLRRLRRK